MKELNLSNLKDILDQYTVTLHRSYTAILNRNNEIYISSKWIAEIVNYFYDVRPDINKEGQSITIGPGTSFGPYIGAFCAQRANGNSDTPVFIDNVTIVELNRAYPTTLILLIDKDEIRFESQELENLYVFIFNNIKHVKNDPDTYLKCRFLLNVMYGLIGTRFLLRKGHPEMITRYVKDLFEPMYNWLDDIFYVDCDMIFVKNYHKYKDVIEELITLRGFEFDTNVYDVRFDRKKKYMLLKDFNIIRTKGYRDTDRDRINNEYRIHRRKRKVRKIFLDA